ncbi:hypothetical protein VPG91_27800 [Nitrospirillum amazonense]|uniref:hypothetical protein n=1 Tax=Nitrospirillum amazonense TaxID=28077 RepID=UPI002DD43A28|nr:hypothetical protein [Nitrospirillum amazonense]MEC4594832.1 hypothetical protein [Nitrospirillum amazonense]
MEKSGTIGRPDTGEGKVGDLLTFRPAVMPDPRLVELVRLLARHAADQYFDGARPPKAKPE